MNMHKDWTWLSRYLLVIVVALVLGSAIGEFSLFKQSTLGTPKLTASMLVKFMGYGGALLLLWLLGRKAADQFRVSGGKTAFMSYVIMPLVTLLVIAGAYTVLLTILRPFLSAGPRNIYNWIFILGITISAIWLAVAVFHHSEPLVDLFKGNASEPPHADKSRTYVAESQTVATRNCHSCGAALVANANFCQVCGEEKQ